MKRTRDDAAFSEQPAKVRRVPTTDRLSRMSDELLVRILGFVPTPTLLVCQLRVSKKFNNLAGDSELWKAAYYKQFVLPRASRIPGIKEMNASSHLQYSSKLSKWLEDSHLLNHGQKTDWKQQFRLRHNWSQGQCAVSEIVVAQPPVDPPLLVMMSNSVIYTADSISGLRAWSLKNERDFIASTPLVKDGVTPHMPTSMAIDTSEKDTGHDRITIGFDDGSFIIYELEKGKRTLRILFEHPPSSNGMLTALAYSSPYLLTMTESHLLSMYAFLGEQAKDQSLEAPKLLYSLRSHTVWPPVSLSIRTASTSMTASIAYALPTYLSGWTVGVQEMRLNFNGELIESRLATAADAHSHTLSGQRSMSSPSTRSSSPFPGRSREPSLAGTPSNSKPTSMSYSHPYLLVAHPDNTLSLYLVKSTASSLSISPGSRLWGHTSSVSGAHVGMRGKAVSVSRLGDELRVWDLEGGMASTANRRRSRTGELSVRVQASKAKESLHAMASRGSPRKHSLRLALDQGFDDASVNRGWVGFDEQNVIVLREKSSGSQALVVYDFT
ncbi:hypothetical protein P280DRAFT_451735 [Massarina eburnea CBS 473.64]|uniref:F-box domain-containing protein n=1 Tax=Massarina eburnea CBS 473.64 TaxID=1395130 RepID=A0A6A6S136_9PLEO|nr:hypothetical protein P280DRAFT_451735 [Massarina eburnea CBS 473.64]